jgi:uncharacterized repeat protein (TIGR03803 family)
MRHTLIRTAGLIACTIVAHGVCVAAPAYKVLYSFSCPSCTDGIGPTRLLQDVHGNFFGTTYDGGRFAGKYIGGQVFELMRTGNDQYTYKDIYDFCRIGNFCLDGGGPGPLVLDKHGNLYGVTWYGGRGAGQAYELTSTGNGWQLRDLYDFCSQPKCSDGDFPFSALTYSEASMGKSYDGFSPLYGVTHGDGSINQGNVFELEPANGAWQEQVLHQFCTQQYCADGDLPNPTLVEDNSGNLYGTILFNGANTNGALFELAQNGGAWSYRIPYSFCSQPDCVDGTYPSTPLAIDSSGNIYGGTQLGGYACSYQKFGCGIVFQLSPGGSQESVLHTFCESNCSDGYLATGVTLFDSAGDMFGTAGDGGNFANDPAGGGTAFQITGGHFSILHEFCGQPACVDGSFPQSLTRDLSGRLFGVTASGGANNKGVIFEIEL